MVFRLTACSLYAVSLTCPLSPVPSLSLPPASAPVNSVSRRCAPSVAPLSWEKRNVAAMSSITIDPELKPGEFVIKSLLAEFAVLAEKKIEVVMAEPLVSCCDLRGRGDASKTKSTPSPES